MADGVLEHLTAGGGTHRVSSTAFAYSSTAAGTAAKTATIYKANNTSGTAASGFTLVDGVQVAVYFVNGNTAANVTLNINSTGAKPVYLNGTERTNAYVSHGWKAGSIVTFIYNTRSNSSGCWTILADNTSWSRQVQIDRTSGEQHGLILGSEFAHTPSSAIPTESVGPLTIAGNVYYNERDGHANMTFIDSPTNTSIRYTGNEIVREDNSRSTSIQFETPSDNRVITVPNASGTLALTSDISGKIDTAGTGLSKSGTTLNHSNSITAQTTQALYPIKIDAQGHISEYGSAVTIPDVSGKIDTAGTGLSKSGTTLNHSNSVTAQTTQAIYPIKIDAQGHISEYGSAVTLPTDTKVTQTPISSSSISKAVLLSSGDGTSETTNSTNVYKGLYFSPYDQAEPRLYIDDGAASNAKSGHYSYDHLTLGNSYNANSTTISAGNVSSNVSIALPTSSGTLALKSDIIDEKVASSTVQDGVVYSLLAGSNTNAASTVFRDSDSLVYVSQDEDVSHSEEGQARMKLGNATPSGTTGNKRGIIQMYDKGTHWVMLQTTDSMEANRIVRFPDASGTLALQNDLNGKIDTAGTGLSKLGTTINHSNSVSAQTTQAVYPIKIDAQGHISAYGSAVTIPDVSGKIDTAGTGLSKSGTTLNHSNSVTAQTTQAVYPIKIDAQGHISGYGSAVTIPTVPTAGTTATAVGTSTSGGSATTWSKSDHVHSISSSTITSALGFTPSSTDNKVAQNDNTDDSIYRILFSNSANDNNETAVSKKSQYLRYNPATPRFFVSSHVEVGAIEYYSQAGVGNDGNGITLDSHSATSYSSAWTPGTFRLQHWSSSKGSGGSITPANFVDTMTYIGTAGVQVTSYDDLNSVTKHLELDSNRLIIGNTLDWSTTTSGVSIVGDQGQINLRLNSSSSKTITPTKIDNWDDHVTNNSSVTAQTTQAVYPIKIDSKGHISAYGSAVTIPTASTTSPSMDGTASYGSGTSYARSNHVHPTDTSRAAKANFVSFTVSSTTTTRTLTSGHVYLLITKRMNNSAAGGVYIVAAHDSTGSVTTVLAGTSTTVSISSVTLTVTTTVNNVYCRLVDLNMP